MPRRVIGSNGLSAADCAKIFMHVNI